MSRIAPPAEKIMAVASIYRGLHEEMNWLSVEDARVQVALIDAATRIAMSTDTRDMGILTLTKVEDPGDHFAHPDADLVLDIDREFR